MSGLQSGLRLALVQLAVTANKQTNLSRVKDLVGQAAKNGANLICLPECFNSPYGVKYFAEYAEPVPDGESTRVLSELANQHSVFLIGGSIPEKGDDGKLYNVCVVHGPDGQLLAKHRKVHLFDIDVPGGIKFTESDALSPGNSLNTFQAGGCKVGLGICYDLRFAEMAKQYNQQGCQLLVYPGAFNMTTGPAHWELLTRARSVDEQLYVACCSPARDVNASYVAWGHSLVCSPWGEVLARADEKEQIIYADIDLDRINEVRTAIPTRHQQRPDVYN